MVLVSGAGAGGYRQAAQEDFIYRREPLISFEGKYQYLYFCVSGMVASAIFLLAYISIQSERHEMRRNEIKTFQGKLHFIKPKMDWCFNNSWQFIGDPSKRQQVYSAYFDMRPDVLKNEVFDEMHIPYGSLRIFAVFPLKLKGEISCIVKFDDSSTAEVQASEALPIHEHFDMPYSAYTIMCPLQVTRSSNTIYLPQSVALAYTANLQSHLKPTYVPISYPKNMERLLEKKKQPRLAICVGPLQQKYSQALRLVEFIEVYLILGASKFYFYHLSASNEVLEVLDYYRRQNIVELREWNFYGYKFENELRYEGNLVQINDCAFRAGIIDDYRYAAIVDLDEIIVPLRHNSLMDYLQKVDEGRASAFVFRNVFFYRKDSNDLSSVPPLIRNRFLYTQAKVRRTLEILPIHSRSKYIVNTRSVLELGNHRVWRAVTGYTETFVHINTGLLFHYRDKCIGCKNILITDYTARRFGSLLWDRVDFMCQTVFGDRGGLCPLE